jgi:hypothetical protein
MPIEGRRDYQLTSMVVKLVKEFNYAFIMPFGNPIQYANTCGSHELVSTNHLLVHNLNFKLLLRSNLELKLILPFLLRQ